MTLNIATDRKANAVGTLWMIAAMAVFAIEDAFLKIAAASLPVGQILIVFGFGGAAVFACVISLKGEPLFTKDVASKPMQVRIISEVIGRLFYTLALYLHLCLL